MRHWMQLSLISIILAFSATISSAAVRIRVELTPKTVPRCSNASFASGIANTGGETISATVHLALHLPSGRVASLTASHIALSAHETLARIFRFRVPSVPLGHYRFEASVEAASGGSDASATEFDVLPAPNGQFCFFKPEDEAVSILLRVILHEMGLQESAPVAITAGTWGTVKQLYK